MPYGENKEKNMKFEQNYIGTGFWVVTYDLKISKHIQSLTHRYTGNNTNR